MDGTRLLILPYRAGAACHRRGPDPAAFAVEDMWTADRIIKDVYSKIAAISTALAGLMSAVAINGAPK